MIGPLLQILLLLDTVARIIDVEDKRLFFSMAPTVLGKKKKNVKVTSTSFLWWSSQLILFFFLSTMSF